MAGSTTVGALKVLMSADSAQITADLGKARRAVKDAQADFALFGRGGKDAEKVLLELGDASTRELGKARQAVNVLTKSFGGLGGTVGQVGNLIGEFATGGLAAFGLSAAAAAAAVTFAVSTISTAVKESTAAQEDATRLATEALRKVHEFTAERFDLSRGTNLSALAASERKVTDAIEDRTKAYKAMKEAGPTSIVAATRAYLAAEEAVNEAIRERARVYDLAAVRQESAVRGLDKVLGEMGRARQQDSLVARLPEDARRAEREIAALSKSLASLTDRVGMGAEDAAAAVRAGLIDQETARRMVQDRADAEEKAARFLQEQTNLIRRRVGIDSVSAIEAEVKALEEELHLKELGEVADRRDFEIRKRITALQESAHRFDLEDRNSAVSRKIALLTKLLHLNRQIRQLEEEPGKKAEDEKLRELQADAADAARRAAEAQERQRDREFDAAGEALGARLDAEGKVWDAIAETRKTATDREVEAVRAKYAETLSIAEDYGIDVVELEAFIASEQARVREEGEREAREKALAAAVSGEDLGEGFRARVSQLREETAGWGRLGAQMADLATAGLSGGVTRALEEVVRGTKSAKEAFKDWAREFAFDIARMIQQALLMRAILSLFPGLSTAGAGADVSGALPVAGASAHGGTFRVSGFGGLDSQLVTMRMSPGEVFKVTNGANSGGEGGAIHTTNVIKVLLGPDELMNRASREAKASLVATVVERGSRRGGRPAE